MAQAQDPASADFFELRIRPVLAENCLGCHGAAEVSKLRLDSRDRMLQGGTRGHAVVPGEPAKSLILEVVEQSNPSLRMPPTGKLTAAQIDGLRAWIAAGAVWPAKDGVTRAPKVFQVSERDRAFWSLAPLKAPEAGAAVDRFIAGKLASEGIEPAPRADRKTLYRRLSYALTGLPPTPAAMAAFLADSSGQAFPKAVDELLESPHFGERWGRFWLDVARYSDDDMRAYGREFYPNAWRYRDWVVSALNKDMPFDRFVEAQIAGDKLGEPAATGLFGLGPWYYTLSPPPQARSDERHDRVDMVGRGLLGLTLGCARCHDHKFDPVSMKDYYALAGVFQSSEYREYPLVEPDVVERFEQHAQRMKDQEKETAAFVAKTAVDLAGMLAHRTADYVEAVRKGEPDGLDTAVYERWKKYLAKPEKDHPYLSAWFSNRGREEAEKFQTFLLSVAAEKAQFDEENKRAVESQRAPKNARKTKLPNGFESYDDFCPGCEVPAKALDRDRYLLWRDMFRAGDKGQGGVLYFGESEIEPFLHGEWKARLVALRASLDELKKTKPSPYAYYHGLGDREQPIDLRIALRGNPYNLGDTVPRRFPEVLAGHTEGFRDGSGRVELARAITAQPIFARVAANRVWGNLFGRGIVATPSNFGRLGERPSHPELLEYLAWRYRELGWSTKRLVRELVLTETWQRANSGGTSEARDGANRFYGRAVRRRLDAEALRDSILAAAGTLDAKVGGPAAELDEHHRRRTLYAEISRLKLNGTLALFDFPSPAQSSEKRVTTNVPPQRLFLLNSEFVLAQAQALACRLESEVGTGHRAKLRRAYQVLFTRDPAPAEEKLALAFLAQGSWPQLAQALLSSNEFSFLE